MAHPRIVQDPAVMMGKPVVKGTRVPVETVLRRLGTGDPVAQILADYPQLTEDDIHAAQAFAADYLAGEEIVAAQ